MNRVLSALVALGLTLSAELHAQGSWREHADWTRRREAADSFNLIRGTTVIGAHRLESAPLTRGSAAGIRFWTAAESAADASEDWIFSDENSVFGVVMRSEVRLSPALLERGLRQEGTVGGEKLRLIFDRGADGFAGTLLMPGSASPMPISVQAGPDVIDDKALLAILPLIRWRDGLSFTIPVLSTAAGSVETQTVTAAERRSSTVPAGSFDVWRITIARSDDVYEVEVTAVAPYRVVRFGIRGALTGAQLVR
jgi:hypothetical protein